MATLQDLVAQIAQLTAENQALKAKGNGKAPSVSMKYTDKGGVSVYGLGRFPVTLYASQWGKLLDKADDIRQFVADGIKAGKVVTKD